MSNDPTLAELFDKAGSDTVNHRGRVVRSLVRIPVRDGSRITVTRREVGSPRAQAVKLGLNRGVLDVNGRREPAVALWSHTAPEVVELVVRGKATTVEVWNAWSMGGVDSSWIGNAGIVSKATRSGQLLRCSDGAGPPSFDDLVVEVDVER